MLDLTGKTILITSGPTYAYIDPVRVISNRSSGRLGSTIAQQLAKFGANVVQLAGENSITAKNLHHLTAVNVQTFGTVYDLKNQLQNLINLHSPDAIFMAAAVLDYVPAETNTEKKSSSQDEWLLRLVRSEKIIEQIKTWHKDTTLIGFKLESNIDVTELSKRALNLINRSGARMVVANLIEDINASQHKAYFVEKGSTGIPIISSPYTTPDEIALAICHRLSDYLQ